MSHILINRKNAITSGFARYYTGKPCKHGHINERRTVNGTCISCEKIQFSSDSHKYNCKKWNEKNRSKRRQFRKDFYYKNIEKEKSCTKKWRDNNKEHLSKYSKKHYEENIKYYKEKKKEHCKRNPEIYRVYASNRRALIAKAEGRYSAKDIEIIYNRQNGKCVYCKKNLDKKYHVDHIMPLSKGGSNYPDNIQVTCQSCNNKKKDKLPDVFAKEMNLTFNSNEKDA